MAGDGVRIGSKKGHPGKAKWLESNDGPRFTTIFETHYCIKDIATRAHFSVRHHWLLVPLNRFVHVRLRALSRLEEVV